jgi:energy-coupling factor transporter transmembrane protein EcfT
VHLRISATLRRPLLLAMSVFVLFYPFAVSSAASAGSPVILDLGWMERQEAGIVLGLSTALRILAAFALTVMFALTTEPQGCVRVLVQQ